MSRIDAHLALQPDPARYTLPCFLEDVVSRNPERCALHFEGEDWSYRALESQVHRMTRALLAAGVSKGSRVAVYMANRPEWVVAAFAIARSGGVLVPVNTFATPPERDHILRHSDASLLIMQGRLLERDLLDELLAEHREIREAIPGRIRCPALPQLRRIFCLGLDRERGGVEPWAGLDALANDLPAALADAVAGEVHPADDGVVIYTSGTTSLPKGVMHLQRAPVIMSWRYAELYGLAPSDVIWTAQPFFWTAGLTMSLGCALASGAKLVLQETFDAGVALELFETHGVTTPFAWGHQEHSLAEHPSFRERELSHVRRVNFGSPLAALSGLEEDEWGYRGAYGLSETFTLASAFHADAPAELRTRSAGPALTGTEIRIVDPADGSVLEPGHMGEIAVRGLTRMRGYAKVDPEDYLDTEGFFHTGDRGAIDEAGHLHWDGRLSNIIKTGGANVSPVEIESALVGFPGLHLGLAVGVPHPRLGEAIVLCAEASPGEDLDPEALRAHLRERIAAYKVPRQVLLFADDELAFTGNQKVQLSRLKQTALDRLCNENVEIAGHRYAASES